MERSRSALKGNASTAVLFFVACACVRVAAERTSLPPLSSTSTTCAVSPFLPFLRCILLLCVSSAVARREEGRWIDDKHSTLLVLSCVRVSRPRNKTSPLLVPSLSSFTPLLLVPSLLLFLHQLRAAVVTATLPLHIRKRRRQNSCSYCLFRPPLYLH